MSHERWYSLALYALLAGMWATRAEAGTVALHDIESEAVAGNQMGITATRRILVYLPDGYAETLRSYPVLYWIPGWETPASREYFPALDRAIADGKLPPVIVVHVDVREGLILLNSPVFGRWEDFITDELVPFVDGRYRTVASPAGRAVMGHSSGGYAAIMLPLLLPGIWSAVGLNDASMWAGCPDEMFGRGVGSDFLNKDFADYASFSGYERARTQIGIALAADPDAALGFSVPDGTATRPPDEWRSHCLLDPAAITALGEGARGLSAVAVGVPTEIAGTNRDENIRLLTALRQAGIESTHVFTHGGHGGDRPRRFIALAKVVTDAMNVGFPDPAITAPTAWGVLKAARAPRHIHE